MKRPNPRKKSNTGKKYEKPLSLYPMSFDQAIDKLLQAKPKSPKKK